jgi:tRNA U34 5-methylaminomethyl-2-thiouridine-forming methyltransferase MnmC
VQESLFIFIENGCRFCKSDPLRIFELGFGTGLNALLTAMEALNGNRRIEYTSIEKYPLEDRITNQLNYSSFAADDGKNIFKLIHSSPWNEFSDICMNFSLKKIKGDFNTERFGGYYDLIYFDAFGPDKQPEMWTPEMFGLIAGITAKNGILMTYSAKGEVKRNLRSCGFEVNLLPGPPGKRQITRAIKN